MLKMDQVHVIRHKVLIEGLSRRQVAKEMGVSRNTVRKYSHEEASEPRFQAPSEPRRRPVLDKVKERIDELLLDWSSRSTTKQRITAARVHEQLLAEDFVVGASTVRSYVREWRRTKQEVFVPLVHRAGDAAQVDFFEVTVELEGVRCKRWMLLIRLMHSGRDSMSMAIRCPFSMATFVLLRILAAFLPAVSMTICRLQFAKCLYLAAHSRSASRRS